MPARVRRESLAVGLPDGAQLNGARALVVPMQGGPFKTPATGNTLCDLYETRAVTQAIFYCNAQRKMDFLADQLQNRDFIISVMHADLDQKEHDLAMEVRSGPAFG